MKLSTQKFWVGTVAIIVTFFVFILPFIFIFLMAAKNKQQSLLRDFTLPTDWQLWENVVTVFSARNFMLWTAFVNSTVLTVGSVTLMVIFGAMVGYVIQRRPSVWANLANYCVLAGLIIPPAVVPTIWLLKGIGLFKTMPGMMLIEVAYALSFCVLLFRAFSSSIPRELDEAATIDGANPIQIFFGIILPLMRPVIITVIVVQSVAVFNDFVNPLYFLPGNENVTIQVTLFNFQSLFDTSYNLLFMNILIITIPPLLVFLFFNRHLVEGLTAGSVKG